MTSSQRSSIERPKAGLSQLAAKLIQLQEKASECDLNNDTAGTLKSLLHELRLLLCNHETDCPEVADSVFRIGLAYYELPDFALAKFYLDLAAKMFIKLKILNNLTDCLDYAGKIEVELGHYASAIQYYQEAVDVLRKRCETETNECYSTMLRKRMGNFNRRMGELLSLVDY